MTKPHVPAARLDPRPGDADLDPAAAERIALFARLERKPSLERFPGAVTVRRFGAGDVVFRQGDAGFTAFYVLTAAEAAALEGNVAEAAGHRDERRPSAEPVAEVRLAVARPAPRRREGLLGRVARVGGGASRPSLAPRPSLIAVDAHTDVEYRSLRAELHEGDVFGEMSCLHGTPRSATVVALRDCRMIEMLRNVFDAVRRDPAFRARMDELYRRRVLDLHLQKLSVLALADAREMGDVRRSAELVSFEPGEVVCAEGSPSDCVFVVRSGLVKVTKSGTAGHADVVLSYCSRGDLIGEMGALSGRPRNATCVAYGHPNEHGRTELVRIPAEVLRGLVERNAAVRAEVERQVATRERRTAARVAAPPPRPSAPPPGRADALGLAHGQRLHLVDLRRCTRCDECVHACAAAHADGRPRLLLDGPRFGRYLVPRACRACLDPVCLVGCPVGAIHRGDEGEIVVEPWCIGCGLCAQRCPYDAIAMYDTGIVPDRSGGWRVARASWVAPDAAWQAPRFADAGWAAGHAPFRPGRDLDASLDRARARRGRPRDVVGDGTLLFRLAFSIGDDRAAPHHGLRIRLATTDPAPRAWLDGAPLEPDAAAGNASWIATAAWPRAKRAVLAVRVEAGGGGEGVLLDARVDPIEAARGADGAPPAPGEKVPTHVALVCDLCGGAHHRDPACVRACPMGAAMRVDGRRVTGAWM